jgi:hypothetical protein
MENHEYRPYIPQSHLDKVKRMSNEYRTNACGGKCTVLEHVAYGDFVHSTFISLLTTDSTTGKTRKIADPLRGCLHLKNATQEEARHQEKGVPTSKYV